MGIPVDTVHFGLGPIGLRILELAHRSPALRVRGAVDVDQALVGRDAGSLSGASDTGGRAGGRAGGRIGIRVVATVGELPDDLRQAGDAGGDTGGAGGGDTGGDTRGAGPPVALHAAGSRLVKVWPQLRELLDAGFSVVSTCEELAYPWHRHPELSREIDRYARQRGLTVLGTGVNPGFVMDALALTATAVLGDVRAVEVRRAVDVSTRRLPLQRKVGVGLEPEVFARLAGTGEIGHVGLEESARLVGYGLGWRLTEVTSTIEATLATRVHRLEHGELEPGAVDGLAQTCRAATADGRRIELDLTMRVEVEPVDEIRLAGDEQLRLAIPGGVPGDTATAAISVNCAKRMDTMDKGLLTMADAGLVRHR